MKISQIYGKRAVSTAGTTGYVISVNAKDGNITGFTCADENEKKFNVNIENVKSIKTVVIYRAGKGEKSGEPVRLGKLVFDCNGTYLGKLTDYTIEKNALVYAHVGNKKFSADDIVDGDAIIVKNSARILKSDVKKNGRIILRKGTPLTPESLEKARAKGEYVQANLKTI